MTLIKETPQHSTNDVRHQKDTIQQRNTKTQMRDIMRTQNDTNTQTCDEHTHTRIQTTNRI